MEQRVRLRILQRDNFICAYCKKKVSQEKAHIDHIIPQSKGGSNKDENLTVACWKCNTMKGARIISQEKKLEIAENGFMDEEKVKRREIYVEDNLWSALKKLAKKKDITMSSIIRESIKETYWKEYQKQL